MVQALCKYVSRYSLLVRGETVLCDTEEVRRFVVVARHVSLFEGPAAGLVAEDMMRR